MADRPTYSLQILLGTIAAFAVAAGAFAEPESIIAVSGGLAAVGVHWLMRDRETETSTPLDNETL